ncbi:tol-pal system protein YbgF [Trichloromonas sp.]|uniref:tol-pal system protein YbgF n=1 Tax=Trichloromonas sp. TaxID=3069249 RepID=UPI002A42A948|nr:tol-pal system protein YbgF [Trichloromonas sp.]
MFHHLGILLLSVLLLTGLTACLAPRPTVDLTPIEGDLKDLGQEQRRLAERLDGQESRLANLEERLQAQEERLSAPASAEPEAKKVTAEREMTPPPAIIAPAPADDTGPDSAAELYRQSFSHYAAGRFARGVDGFQDFLRQYPEHEYTGHAKYWLGECFYSQQRYEEAVAAYKRAVENHPKGSKAPDALLKMSEALKQLGQTQHADAALQALSSRYPESRAAHSLNRN